MQVVVLPVSIGKGRWHWSKFDTERRMWIPAAVLFLKKASKLLAVKIARQKFEGCLASRSVSWLSFLWTFCPA